jgi:hypothetical protein
MKKIVFLALCIMFIAACSKDSAYERYAIYRPVYMTKESVRNNIRNGQPAPIWQPGKLVWKDNYVFLNDLDRGVHIIDISNPAQPKTVSFIQIPGCVDLAVNDHYLYADCYTDLVTIDISNPLQIQVKQFLSGVFPQRVYDGFEQDTASVIQEWVRKDTLIKKDFDRLPRRSRDFFGGFTGGMLYSASFSNSSNAMAGQGVAGSMARFALMDKRMYTVSKSDLKTFNISNAAAPSYVSAVGLMSQFGFGGDIETIFPYNDKLFIGTQTGMFICNTQNPDKPKVQGLFGHMRSCDPVIADGGYAYVTLRGGRTCGGALNQLDILDINNLDAPRLIKSYAMTGPSGLSKDGAYLFICDGADGLRILNAGYPYNVQPVKQLNGFDAYDVIAANGTAIVVAKDGLHLVDYKDPFNIKELGKILITQK